MSAGCPNNLFKAECQTVLCMNDWAFDAKEKDPSFRDSQEIEILCKGFGGAYDACGACTKLYDFTSCCNMGNTSFSCFDAFVKKEPDCKDGQGFVSSLSMNLTPSSTGSGSLSSSTPASTTATSSSSPQMVVPTSTTPSSGSTAISTTSTPSTGSTSISNTASAASTSSSHAAGVAHGMNAGTGGLILVLLSALRFI